MAPKARCDVKHPCTPKPKGAKSTDTTTDEGIDVDVTLKSDSTAEGARAGSTSGSTKSKSNDSKTARRTRVGSGSGSGGGSSLSPKAKLSDPTIGGNISSGSSAKAKTNNPSGSGGRSKVNNPGTASKAKKIDDPTRAGSSSVPADYKGTGSSSVTHDYIDPSSSSVPATYKKVDLDTTKLLERAHKSQEFSDEMGVEAESVPESAHDEVTRDSAEVVEQDSEFRTALTRDSFEAEQHAGHKIGEGEQQDVCEILRKCKEEVEAAIEAGECEIMQCPSLDRVGTPGDVCAQFCHDRVDSPKSVAELDVSSKKSKFCAKWSKKKGRVECDMRVGPRKLTKAEVVCKGTYKSDEVYVSLWGSSKALDLRKRLESQMKKKRNLLEIMHRKEFLRRQKMRRRAREKRRALKLRDPSKISNGDDNLRINKAYDLRVNYNKQLPMMPGTMQLHFDKFKKPPFKTYVTGQKVCTKRIDEFEKLRVPEKTESEKK